MQPGRVLPLRTTSFRLVAALAAVAVGLGVQVGLDPPADAAPIASPSASPTPAPTSASTPGASPSPAPAAAAAPILSMDLTVSPAGVSRSGQVQTYKVHARNYGDVVVHDLVVTAVAPNLHALVCAPVAQGGTLVAGATTTCTGTRASSQEDLRNHGRVVYATVAGLAPDGSGASTTVQTVTGAEGRAPAVTDDAVTVLSNTAPVVLPGSTNDSPGEVGAPSLDVSRTVLAPAVDSDPDTTARTTPHGTFQVLANGSIRYAVTPSSPDPYPSGWTDTVYYRTYDTAGSETTGTVSVVVRRPPIANEDSLSTGRGRSVSVDPLANDKPGQELDGGDAAFDRATLRFSAQQPGPGTVSPSGDVVTLPNGGVFTLAGGRVTFLPDARSAEPVSVRYSVRDSSGVLATGRVSVVVNAPAPVVTHDVAVTTALTPVELPGALDDSPALPGHTVSFGGFVGRDRVTNLGSSLSTPQGSWSVAPDGPDATHGPVVFKPAWGFSGTVVQHYLARDSAGGETVSSLTVTVQPGPTARPDTLATRAGTDGTTNPAANDTPGRRVDSSVSTFDPRWAVFPEAGQPAGGVVADHGKTLTLPGRGRLWFSNGMVVFHPQAGSRGFAGTVAYQVEDTSRAGSQRAIAAVGRITVLATSDALTATDDSATTSLNRPVTLPAATNDDPGTTTTALRPVFPAVGQPGGSVRAADGLTLTVPGQGVWAASPTTGTVGFTPAVAYAGTTAAVTYRISGAGGATATARLQVTVAPGAAAAADVVTRPEDSTSVDPLLNDHPGRSADGRLGTLVPTSVRLPAAGQPPGSVVTGGGRTLLVPARGPVPSFTVSVSPDGEIGVTPGTSFHGSLPPIAYSVLSDVADSTGVVSRQHTRSTVRLTLTGGDIVTTDDHRTVRSGRVASLPGASNDSPAPGFFPFDFDEMGFASTGQPPGSEIVDDAHGHDHEYSLVVPDEGVWRISGGGFMSFTPDAGFVGDTSPVRYAIVDFAFLHFGTGAETVTVLPPAVPRADAATTPQGTAVVVHTLANDTPELDPTGRPYANADLVTFDPARRPPGSTLTPGRGNKQLVVPHQGTYTIDHGTGDVRLLPDPTFRGSASAFFLRVPGGASRFQATVQGVDPIARDDSVSTAAGVPVRVRLFDNDAPGTPVRPLVPNSVRLRTVAGLPAGTALSTDAQTLTIPGRGVFAAAGDGTLTFYPLAGATGTVPTVGYSMADVNRTKVTAAITVRVR